MPANRRERIGETHQQLEVIGREEKIDARGKAQTFWHCRCLAEASDECLGTLLVSDANLRRTKCCRPCSNESRPRKARLFVAMAVKPQITERRKTRRNRRFMDKLKESRAAGEPSTVERRYESFMSDLLDLAFGEADDLSHDPDIAAAEAQRLRRQAVFALAHAARSPSEN